MQALPQFPRYHSTANSRRSKNIPLSDRTIMYLYRIKPRQRIIAGDVQIQLLSIRQDFALLGLKLPLGASPPPVPMEINQMPKRPRSHARKVHHTVKIWPQNLDPIWSGERTADLRVNDRDYQPFDIVTYQAYDPASETYIEGRGVTVQVTDVMRFNQIEPRLRDRLGLNPSLAGVDELVILSIRRI
jgi:hypothetical protein